MAGRLVIQENPDLTNPYVLMGYKGWLNAGEVSTGSIDFLRRKLNAQKFAYIDSHGFYIYQVPGSTSETTMRPHTRIKDGLVKKFDLPQNHFFFWKSGGPHDLILFLGVEPNLDWPEYAGAVFDVARRYKAPRIYSLGGIFDQVPHTRETRIYATVSHPGLKEELRPFAHFSDYEGPGSFTAMMLALANEQGLEMSGLSARTPLYIQDMNAKACHDLLENVLILTGFHIDLSELGRAAETLMEMMDKAFRENATALTQLKKLEEIFDAPQHEASPLGAGKNGMLLEEMRRLKRDGRKLH